MTDDRVPVGPLRERYHELLGSGRYTQEQIAMNAGYVRRQRNSQRGDTQRLKRKLGINPTTSRKWVGGRRVSYSYVQENLSLGEAARLAEALELDPVELGW